VAIAFLTSKMRQSERRMKVRPQRKMDRIEKITALVPHLLGIAHKKMWVNYDQEAGVLYVNL